MYFFLARNRFNLRGSVRTTAATLTTENSENDSPESEAPSRSARPRPGFSARGRGRPTPSTTAEPDAANEQPADQEDVKPTAAVRPRLNIPKPNRFLTRGRSPITKPTDSSAPADTESNKDEEKVKEEDDNNGEEKQTSETTTASGLNRLKNRPRLQITKPAERPKAPALNRKPNPLLARRRPGGLGASTTAVPVEDPVEKDENESGDKESDEHEAENEKEIAVTELVEPVTEAPRGLGLLGNRRRPLLRKPGTLLQSS